jgi:tRNA pseudouridine13 synthase
LSRVKLVAQKTDANTEYIARQLAKFASVPVKDVSFAGLKDRHAVTTQWFSVWLPGKPQPDWMQLNSDNMAILQVTRHARKLKRGALANNQFCISVRGWQGDTAKMAQQLQTIQQHGIPNYYGPQRFGHNGNNVEYALALFAGRKVSREQRSLYLSVARSWLFNHILAARVEDGSWQQALAGDTLMLDGSHSCFRIGQPDSDVLTRIATHKLHPTSVLWGVGQGYDELLAVEQAVLAQHPELVQGLITFKVEMERRALRVNVPDLAWHFQDSDTLIVTFSLPAGSFATAVLREILVDV